MSTPLGLNHENPMEISRRFLNEIIEEAKADEVGLWFLIGRIRDDLGVEDPILLQAWTFECVDQLLASGGVVAGYYNPDGSGYNVWDMDPKRIISRIEQAWNELGREPNIGEVVVFIGNSHRASEPAK